MRERERQDEMRMGIVRSPPDRIFRPVDRGLELADIYVGAGQKGQMVMEVRILRIERLRQLHTRDALGVSSQVGFVAERVQNRRIVRIQLDGAVGRHQRGIVILEPLIGRGENVVTERGSFIELHGMPGGF